VIVLSPFEIIIMTGAVIAAVTGIIVFSMKIAKGLKRVVHFLDDFNGEEARPGIPERLGMSARISQLENCVSSSRTELEQLNKKVTFIEKELHPNHGTSMRDKVDRIVLRLDTVEEKIIDHVSK
jgi:uncharacterized coiled-coil protein SlyX